MTGWISLHRKIYESDLWNDVTTFRLFTYLLLHASHKDGVKINGIELKRGQWIRSTRKLAEDLSYKEGRGVKKYSTNTINKCIHKLVDSDRVSIQQTEVGTLFTVLNYALYQDVNKSEKETENGSKNEVRTNGERSKNNNNNANNDNNANKKPSRPKQVYDKESIHYQLANRLFEKIKENSPSFKEPNIQKWSDDIRKMIDIDKRTSEQIAYVIDWAQQDYFWKSNILSTFKLRKNFDQLVIKIKSERQNDSKSKKQRKLISLEKPDHVKEPELPEDIDDQISKMLKEIED